MCQTGAFPRCGRYFFLIVLFWGTATGRYMVHTPGYAGEKRFYAINFNVLRLDVHDDLDPLGADQGIL